MRTNRLQFFAHAGNGMGRQDSLDMLRDCLRAIAATVRSWRRRRRERQELARLDDRTLRDIGLTRGDAEFLINKPLWRQ